jgi:hypothetical protein
MQKVIKIGLLVLLTQGALVYARTNYKLTDDYIKLNRIINSPKSTNEKLVELFRIDPIYGAKIPQTWLLHEAIKNNSFDDAANLIAEFGDDIVAQVGHASNTLPLAQRMEYDFRYHEGEKTKNAAIQDLIKKHGGHSIRLRLVADVKHEWEKNHPGQSLRESNPDLFNLKDDEEILVQE